MWGWIVLAVFAAILLFLFMIPVRVVVEHRDRLTARIQILFWKIPIDVIGILRSVLVKEESPPEPEPKKEEPVKKEEDPKPEKEDYLKKLYREEGAAGVIALLQNVFDTLNVSCRFFLRHFIIRRLLVKVVITGFDAAQTAKAYGSFAKSYYPFIGAVRGGMTVKKYEEEIIPDYLANRGEHLVYFNGSIRIAYVLGFCILLLKTFLCNMKRTSGKKTKSKAEKAVQ